jgi:flagellar biosynthesis protein
MEKKEIKKASALAYTPGENSAPKVVASGKGVNAEKIIEVAKKEKIPVVQDAHLAETLDKLRVGSEIPAELYEVVAEVLSFISRVDEEAGRKFGAFGGRSNG